MDAGSNSYNSNGIPLSEFNNIKNRWKAFTEKHILDPSSNPIVAQSWVRSISINVDYNNLNPPFLAPVELDALRKKYHLLIDIAKSLIEKLVEVSNHAIDILSLHDKDGYMMEIFNEEPEFFAWHHECFCPGVCWAEDKVGTNTIGLVLHEKKPIELLGAEHYNSNLHNISGCSSPIFNPDGEMIGVLCVSSSNSRYSHHLKTLVSLCCYAIQFQLSKHETNIIDKQILGYIGENILVLDRRHTIIRCTNQFAATVDDVPESMLGVHILDIFHGTELADKLNSDVDSWEVFECRGFYNNKQMICNIKANRIYDEGRCLGFALIITNNNAISRETAMRMGYFSFHSFKDLKSSDPIMLRVLEEMKEAALSEAPILIEGQSGLYKQIYAEAIHSAGPNKNMPFVTLNCDSVSSEVITLHLFGCEAGYYPESESTESLGRLEIAQGGTLLMTNIDKLSLDNQYRLLQMLTTRHFRRLGGKTDHPVKVRIITTATVNVETLVKDNMFLQELYEILKGFLFRITPLASRKKDIPSLAELRLYAMNHTNGTCKVYAPNFIDSLQKYHWPNNQRQLDKYITKCYYSAQDNVIRPITNDIAGFFTTSQEKDFSILDSADEAEKRTILEKLEKNHFDVAEAAKDLRISRATLYRKMRKYSIKCKELKG